MTQPTDIWSSQLRIVTGRAVEEAPQVGFVEKRDQRGRLVRLSILAEPVADGAETFIDQFVRRLGELFNPAARSLTGAVKHAVDTTHEELRNWNRAHLRDEHAMYGVSVLIQRADQPAVLGQVGPSVGLLAGDAGLAGLRSTALYSHATRRDDPVANAIGSSLPINIEFASAPPALDGWALLLTSNAGALLDPERRVALSRMNVDETLGYLYPAMLNLRDAAGVVVKLGGGQPSRAVDPEPQEEAATEDPSADEHVDGHVDDDLDGTEDKAVDDSRRRSFQSAGLEPEGSQPERGEDAAAAIADRRSSPPDRAQQWDVSFDPPAVSELEVIGWPVNPFAVTRVDQIQTMSVPVASAPPLSRPIMDLGRAIPSLLENRREPAVERPRIRDRSAARSATARRVGMVLAGMLVVLVGVAAVLLGPSLLQSDQDQFQGSLDRARNGLAASQLSVTTEGALLALQDALGDVESALEVNPLAADASQLREEIEALLAELNLVQSPGALTTIADLTRFGPSIALGTVRFGAGRAFVLDDAGGRIFSVSREGAVTVIFLEGELLGLSGQLRAGKPISLVWQSNQSGQSAQDGSAVNGAADATGEDALWILDSHSRLYRWTPSGVLLVPIPDQVRLGSVDAVAATAGSIYLLDQAGGAVWRYPVDRSELGQPTRAVGRTDLLNASELLAIVNTSGAVEFLIASSDGRLRRFSGDEELPLALGLERNLLSPASLSLGAQSGLVYLVDRGEGRIIAVGPDGAVVSQIQSAALADLRGAWVDEQTGQITYALSSSILTGRLPDGQE
jgi:hypothetical protein